MTPAHLTLLLASLLAVGDVSAQTATPEAVSQQTSRATAAETVNPTWTEGEVVRLDAATGRITLRHGEITNLGMPSMTMVFRIPDTSLPGPLQVGDKVRFQAEKIKGAYTVTRIEPAH